MATATGTTDVDDIDVSIGATRVETDEVDLTSLIQNVQYVDPETVAELEKTESYMKLQETSMRGLSMLIDAAEDREFSWIKVTRRKNLCVCVCVRGTTIT